MNNLNLTVGGGTDARLANFIRQYSGDYKQSNIDQFQLPYSGNPNQIYNFNQSNDLLSN
jgi:hypothetical protein